MAASIDEREPTYTTNPQDRRHGTFQPPPDAAWDPSLEPDEADDEPQWTELQLASRYGDIARIQSILAACSDDIQKASVVNAPPVGYYGQTALQAACMRGHEEVVRILLGEGADIHAAGGNNVYRNAFELACGNGNMAIVQLLLNADAIVDPVHVTRYQGRTPIQAASESGHEEIVKLLLSLGANVNAPASPSAGVTALQAACWHGHVNLAKLLLASGADVNGSAGKFKGYTALQAACLSGRAEIVELLLRSGADVNAAGSVWKGGPALHAAVAGGHIEIVRTLLAAGADPNIETGRQGGVQSALQSAFLIGRTDIIDLLREAGATGPVTGGKMIF